MKVLTLVFIVALLLSPGIRSLTANTLHTVADIIEPQWLTPLQLNSSFFLPKIIILSHKMHKS